MDQIGGNVWILVAIGIVVAGLAMAFGTMRSRKRTRGEARAQEAATRDLYRNDPE
jgi:type II secretory pathway pseudopilin PulG